MTQRPRVKVCGVMGPEEARRVAELGADAVGLNFYPPSPRYVGPAAAAAILRELPPFVEAVGLFVNVPLREAVARLAALPRVRCVQWHGEGPEPPDGSGYDLMIEQAEALDAINPQVASRMVRNFERFKRFEPERRALMRAALQRVAATPGLSRETAEVVGKALA